MDSKPIPAAAGSLEGCTLCEIQSQPAGYLNACQEQNILQQYREEPPCDGRLLGAGSLLQIDGCLQLACLF